MVIGINVPKGSKEKLGITVKGQKVVNMGMNGEISFHSEAVGDLKEAVRVLMVHIVKTENTAIKIPLSMN